MPRLLLLLVLFNASVADAADRAVPSLEEWMSLKAADVPSLSPDGRRVAYMVRTPDWKIDRFDDELWLVDIETGEHRPLTNAPGHSTTARWSPDGRRLAFLSSRTGAAQVFVLSPPDTTPSRLTSAESGVEHFQWSPDGRRIAYTTSARVARAKEPAEFHVVGDEDVWSSRLWIMDADGRSAPVAITDSSAISVDDIFWSPDSKRIAFHASTAGAPYSFGTYDIYVVRLDDRSVTRVAGNNGPDFFPIWSPDGSQLVYRTYVWRPDDKWFAHSMGRLAIVPAAGGASRVVTESFDEQPTPFAWTSKGIYFAARQRTYQHLFLLDPATGAIRRLTEPFESVNFAFSFSADGTRMAFVRADSKHYQEVFVGPVEQPQDAVRLTHMGDQLDRWQLATRELVQWKSADGTPIEGVLVKPVDFDSTRKYPLVVIVHGGPADVDQATITRDMVYPAELFASRGALVLRPNYRGSIGYGARFRELLADGFGLPEYEDVVSGVDALVARGIVDTARLGLMGWSHGGYIAALATTYGDRFKAVSMGAGVSDFTPFYAMGAGTALPPDPKLPVPWWDAESHRRSTPLTYSQLARTPTLIQHGENDGVSPIVSAHALHRALKDRGVPTKMIVYNGVGHLPYRLGQYKAVVEHNLEWFDHWLWGNPDPLLP
ncbi:MAG: S9 family peptidase [Candidatus Eiseniibacteriota bacterium]